MDLKKQRKQYQALIRNLELPVPFDVTIFCQSLGARRGRPVLLVPIDSKAGPYGAWVATSTADFLFYEKETSPLHQSHIILHEVSHLLCEHRPVLAFDGEFSRVLFPHLESQLVERMLARGGYTAEEEKEAELLASLILERVSTLRPLTSPIQDDQTTILLQRLETSLEWGPARR